ncbi:hypothetical protein M3J09_012801 [Ascochyta lentis]
MSSNPKVRQISRMAQASPVPNTYHPSSSQSHNTSLPSTSNTPLQKANTYPLTGRCPCSHITYTLSSAPLIVHACHCTTANANPDHHSRSTQSTSPTASGSQTAQQKHISCAKQYQPHLTHKAKSWCGVASV